MNTDYREMAVATTVLTMTIWAHAQSAEGPLVIDRSSAEIPYVVDSSSTLARSNHGLCWRTGYWSVSAASTTKVVGQPFPAGCYCDKDLMPKPACEPQPVAALEVPPPAAGPAPAPAPAPAPVPIADKVTVPADALFDFDRADITQAGRERLGAFAEQLKALNLETVVAVGHADRIGTEQYNQALSERRAAAIKDFLVAQGVDAARVFIEGRGKTQPVTGDKCKNMGKESARNRPLIECLAPDRRVVLEAVGTRR